MNREQRPQILLETARTWTPTPKLERIQVLIAGLPKKAAALPWYRRWYLKLLIMPTVLLTLTFAGTLLLTSPDAVPEAAMLPGELSAPTIALIEPAILPVTDTLPPPPPPAVDAERAPAAPAPPKPPAAEVPLPPPPAPSAPVAPAPPEPPMPPAPPAAPAPPAPPAPPAAPEPAPEPVLNSGEYEPSPVATSGGLDNPGLL